MVPGLSTVICVKCNNKVVLKLSCLVSALGVVVEAPDGKDDLLWNSICSEYAPYTISGDAVESLPKIYVVDVHLLCHSVHCSISDVGQSKDQVRASILVVFKNLLALV